jgi:hypothetical protein
MATSEFDFFNSGLSFTNMGAHSGELLTLPEFAFGTSHQANKASDVLGIHFRDLAFNKLDDARQEHKDNQAIAIAAMGNPMPTTADMTPTSSPAPAPAANAAAPFSLPSTIFGISLTTWAYIIVALIALHLLTPIVKGFRHVR